MLTSLMVYLWSNRSVTSATTPNVFKVWSRCRLVFLRAEHTRICCCEANVVLSPLPLHGLRRESQ